MKGDKYTGGMRGFKQSPLNCDLKEYLPGGKVKCPKCNAFHLRAGYCSALGPQLSEAFKEAWIRKRASELRDETLTQDETLNETLTGLDETLNYCEVCGEAFEAKRRTARYCGSPCRLKAHRASEVSDVRTEGTDEQC